MQQPLLMKIRDLKVHFQLDTGILKAVDGVDMDIVAGRTLGLVGESGCGKSVSIHAILRLLPKTAKITGSIAYYGRDGRQEPREIVNMLAKGKEIRTLRGGDIAMIFQEPMKAFSPVHTIGNQLMEAVLEHVTQDKAKARDVVLKSLKDVGMSNVEQRFNEYPHQLSGGMRQRAIIAMALSCSPRILIADEPTTALDVTVQAQVLDLINELKEKMGTSVIFVTHDLGVIAEMSDEVAVMYLGKIVEYTDVDTLFYNPLHPYTRALMDSIPRADDENKRELTPIKGVVPYPMNLPAGCGFYSRCPRAVDGVCNVKDVPMRRMGENHLVRCLLVEEV